MNEKIQNLIRECGINVFNEIAKHAKSDDLETNSETISFIMKTLGLVKINFLANYLNMGIPKPVILDIINRTNANEINAAKEMIDKIEELKDVDENYSVDA